MLTKSMILKTWIVLMSNIFQMKKSPRHFCWVYSSSGALVCKHSEAVTGRVKCLFPLQTAVYERMQLYFLI